MHILPLPLCGLYSIRNQNVYGQHGLVDPGSTQGSHRVVTYIFHEEYI